MNNITNIIQALQNADWTGTNIGNKAIIKAAILALMDADKNENFRARATQAEQDRARLREEVARKPQYDGLMIEIKRKLGLPQEVAPPSIIQQIENLKFNQELYKKARDANKMTQAERTELSDKSFKAGKDFVWSLIDNLRREDKS